MLVGLGLRLFAVFLITAMSAVIHAVGDRVPLGEIMVWRSAVALFPILSYMAIRRDLGSLVTRRPWLHVTRGGLGALSMALSFLSLIWLPVANAQALGYLAPVLSLPLAALLLGEHLTAGTVVAIAIGFCGAILMLWQAFEMPGTGALLGVGAGLGYAATMAFVRVHIRAMTVHESAGAIAFYFAVSATLVGLALAPPWTWPPIDRNLAALLVLAGLIGGVGHIASTEAAARAPVSVLAPFEFTGLVWAVGFDLFLFGLVPGPLAVAGIAAILAAALIVFVPARRRGG